ncbi:thioesterase family protein [Alkalihalobacillus sp. TS-13]|uniref:acyl-CoA thioesterase n=1 Tax=Alkalihalobacillus sp. TS-13 TaxID=2842455 RepID=UPI001C88B799|nr:thioesterase family protein [Alkalihalobacillus sp. TS-13]
MKGIEYIQDWESWRMGFHFYTTVDVRFSEVDPFNHLNNTIPFVYFEDARIQLFKELGFMQEWSRPDSKTIPVVADLQCNYLKQVLFDETLKIFVKIAYIGTTSIDLHYLAEDSEGNPVLVGRGRIVHIDKHLGAPEKWTASMIDRMKNMQK